TAAPGRRSLVDGDGRARRSGDARFGALRHQELLGLPPDRRQRGPQGPRSFARGGTTHARPDHRARRGRWRWHASVRREPELAGARRSRDVPRDAQVTLERRAGPPRDRAYTCDLRWWGGGEEGPGRCRRGGCTPGIHTRIAPEP